MTSGSKNSSSTRAIGGLRKWMLIIAPALLFSACENELKDAKTISAKEVEVSVEHSENVKLTYSDSAHVKAILFAPVLLHYQTTNPYYEMPKGVNVIFYDDKMGEQNRVRSDYAIKRENERVTELRDHVVITTRAGDTYKSDQMFWDENTHRFFSNKRLTRLSKKGETGYAESFESDENFLHPIGHGTSGNIFLPERATTP